MILDCELSTACAKGKPQKNLIALMGKLINAKPSINCIHVTQDQYKLMAKMALSTIKQTINIDVGRMSYMGRELVLHRDE